MHVQAREEKSEFYYRSERIFGPKPATFRARYRSLQKSRVVELSSPGTIEHFLTERYRLYTTDRKGQLYKGDIHHVPWPLEQAEAEFEVNLLPRAHGIELPDSPAAAVCEGTGGLRMVARNGALSCKSAQPPGSDGNHVARQLIRRQNDRGCRKDSADYRRIAGDWTRMRAGPGAAGHKDRSGGS
jgi:hypothetical protein